VRNRLKIKRPDFHRQELSLLFDHAGNFRVSQLGEMLQIELSQQQVVFTFLFVGPLLPPVQMNHTL
jgi:hypothetical protein